VLLFPKSSRLANERKTAGTVAAAVVADPAVADPAVADTAVGDPVVADPAVAAVVADSSGTVAAAVFEVLLVVVVLPKVFLDGAQLLRGCPAEVEAVVVDAAVVPLEVVFDGAPLLHGVPAEVEAVDGIVLDGVVESVGVVLDGVVIPERRA
jgi:hypothetical protein